MGRNIKYSTHIFKDIIRQLLAEAKEEERKEQEEQMSGPTNPTPLDQSIHSYPPQETCTCFGTERRKKRRRMVLEMLKEVAEAYKNSSDSDSMSLSSAPSATSPSIKKPNESLRRKLFKKRLGISSLNSAPQFTPTPPRRSIELVVVGEIRPPPAISSRAKTVEGLIIGSMKTKPFTPPVRRRLLSDTSKERPMSVCDMPPLPLADMKDSLSVDDVRLEKARKVTEYLAGDEGLHLLHENKEMAGSVSSYRATLQAKRLGIKTRRQKMKDIIRQLLAEAKEEERKEQEEQMSGPTNPTPLDQSIHSYPPQETCTCFGTERRKKRRRMVLEMLKEVAEAYKNSSDSDSMSLSSAPSATSPSIKKPNESLRRKLFKKRLGISSLNSAPQFTPTPPRRSIELVVVGEIRPPPAISSRAKTVEGLIIGSMKTKPFTPPVRRRLLSDTSKERPMSVCDMPPLPLADMKDSLSVDDVRLEKARKVTEYLAGDEGLHLLHENKEMAGSVSNRKCLIVLRRTTLYMMAQLTNWYNPELSSYQTVMESWANMWMKLFSAFLALLLYLWTLCFMRFCFNRSLIQTPLNPATHWVAKEPEGNHKRKESGRRKFTNPSPV
nr:hypothetical transcript [Hymenolepis microstoma]